MKKIILVALIIFFTTTLPLASSSAGASLSISTSKDTYQIGDIFSLPISINSGGNSLQVVRAKINYPANLLQAQGFILSSLFPETSPGNSIGNGLIYQGGYRLGDGASQNGLFGTATFKVIKSGTAKISLVAGSRMITTEPEDIYGGGNTLTLTLAATTEPPADEEEKNNTTEDTTNTTTTLAMPLVSSSSHPQHTWTNNKNAIITWTKPKGATGYVTKLLKGPNENIGNVVTTTANSQTFNDLDDGLWYFHVKAKAPNTFSKIAYYPVRIDSTPPNEPVPVIEGEIRSSGNIFQLYFNTIDIDSGIDYYEIKFDNGNFKKVTSPYKLNTLEAKTKLVTVKATDKAGNSKVSNANIKKYISEKEEEWFRAGQDKITLFDVQAESAGRSWKEVYLALIGISLLFIVIIATIIFRKRKK